MSAGCSGRQCGGRWLSRRARRVRPHDDPAAARPAVPPRLRSRRTPSPIGRAVPHPSVARLLTPTIRAAWRASAERRDPDRVGGALPPQLDPRRQHARRELPGRARQRSGAAGSAVRSWRSVRPRAVGASASSVRATPREPVVRPPSSSAASWQRQASSSCRAWPRVSTAPPTHGVLRADGAPPAAVVGNGPDQPYPRVHAQLWEEVCRRGVLLVGVAAGTVPEPFRFPLRNRILAALSEVLVVVESRERGGSLITAQAAIERSIDVMAVPGSVRNRAAAGTNQLLRDGAAPVTSVDDVLVALGLDTRRVADAGLRPPAAAAGHRRRRAGAVPARSVHVGGGRRRARVCRWRTRR